MVFYEILIVDDYFLFCSVLYQVFIFGLGFDVCLVEVVSIVELEVWLNEKVDWDLVLLDFNMLGVYGFFGLVLLCG